jgi:hypothetical protein
MYQRVSALLVPAAALDVDAWSASRPSIDDDVRDAAAISTYINDHLPLHVCAVCGVYRGATQVEQLLPASQLPMHLLRVDGPGLNGRPPAGFTVCCIDGVKYCFAPEGVGTIDNTTFSPVVTSSLPGNTTASTYCLNEACPNSATQAAGSPRIA